MTEADDADDAGVGGVAHGRDGHEGGGDGRFWPASGQRTTDSKRSGLNRGGGGDDGDDDDDDDGDATWRAKARHFWVKEEEKEVVVVMVVVVEEVVVLLVVVVQKEGEKSSRYAGRQSQSGPSPPPLSPRASIRVRVRISTRPEKSPSVSLPGLIDLPVPAQNAARASPPSSSGRRAPGRSLSDFKERKRRRSRREGGGEEATDCARRRTVEGWGCLMKCTTDTMIGRPGESAASAACHLLSATFSSRACARAMTRSRSLWRDDIRETPLSGRRHQSEWFKKHAECGSDGRDGSDGGDGGSSYKPGGDDFSLFMLGAESMTIMVVVERKMRGSPTDWEGGEQEGGGGGCHCLHHV